MDSQNYSARDTRRLGATIDVEQSAVRFLGSLVLVSRSFWLSLHFCLANARTSGTVVDKTPSSTTT